MEPICYNIIARGKLMDLEIRLSSTESMRKSLEAIFDGNEG